MADMPMPVGTVYVGEAGYPKLEQNKLSVRRSLHLKVDERLGKDAVPFAPEIYESDDYALINFYEEFNHQLINEMACLVFERNVSEMDSSLLTREEGENCKIFFDDWSFGVIRSEFSEHHEIGTLWNVSFFAVFTE